MQGARIFLGALHSRAMPLRPPGRSDWVSPVPFSSPSSVSTVQFCNFRRTTHGQHTPTEPRATRRQTRDSRNALLVGLEKNAEHGRVFVLCLLPSFFWQTATIRLFVNAAIVVPANLRHHLRGNPGQRALQSRPGPADPEARPGPGGPTGPYPFQTRPKNSLGTYSFCPINF